MATAFCWRKLAQHNKTQPQSSAAQNQIRPTIFANLHPPGSIIQIATVKITAQQGQESVQALQPSTTSYSNSMACTDSKLTRKSRIPHGPPVNVSDWLNTGLLIFSLPQPFIFTFLTNVIMQTSLKMPIAHTREGKIHWSSSQLKSTKNSFLLPTEEQPTLFWCIILLIQGG